MALALVLPDNEVFTFSRETGVVRTHVFAELEVVRLLTNARNFDGEHVSAGSIGTIVSVYDKGAAYDVEVSNPPSLVAVRGKDIESAE